MSESLTLNAALAALVQAAEDNPTLAEAERRAIARGLLKRVPVEETP